MVGKIVFEFLLDKKRKKKKSLRVKCGKLVNKFNFFVFC